MRGIAGISLLEVMVAMLLLSVGLSSSFSLQSLGMQTSASANFRTIATMLGDDAIERVHSNYAGFLAGGYDSKGGGATNDCFSESGCTAMQLAHTDLGQLREFISDNLPEGGLAICRDSTPYDGDSVSPACDGLGGLLVVKIWWHDVHDLEKETLHVASSSLP